MAIFSLAALQMSSQTFEGLIPVHYKNCFRSLINFATIWSCVALISGLLLRESSRLVPTSLPLSAGDRLSVLLTANLSHGHIFQIGVFLPAALIVFMLVAKIIGGRDIRESSLRISLKLFKFGAFLALALQLYKGIHTEWIVNRHFKASQSTDLLIDESLFAGIKLLRMGLYAVSHVLLGSGISMWMVSIARTLRA